MTKFNLLAAGLALVLSSTAGAQIVPLAERGHVIPYGKSGQYALKVPADCRSVRLIVSVRMDSPNCAGSTHILRMKMNGKDANGAIDRANSRLLNKPLTAKTAGGTEMPWVQGADWRVVYAPDFEIANSPKAGPGRIQNGSAYRLVLDVTDLVAHGRENKLLLEHLGEAKRLRRYFPKVNPSLDFVFDELAVDFSHDPPIGAATRQEEKFQADRLMIEPPAKVDVGKAVTIQPGGGLRIDLPGLPLQVVSRFSCQGGGFNLLAADGPPTGQPEWKPTVARSASEGLVSATAKEYRLERSIRFAGDHVQIADRLTNLTGEAIGLAFDNRLVSTRGAIIDAWLGGNPDPALATMETMENTSVFVAGTQSGCGLLADDDVYRIQAMLYYDQGAGARSDTFALGPKASYTVRWSVYPVRRPDYYDFINLARRDLDVNFTVPGGFQFGLGASSDDSYRAMAHLRGLAFLASGVWFNRPGDVPCYHGEHMLEAAALRKRLTENCAAIRRAVPQVKSLVYIHSFLNSDPAGPQKHPAARILKEDGTQYEYPGERIPGVRFLYNYPALEPDNSYFAAMKRVIDMCLDRDKIGADGIYWDELDWISTRYTFDRWDGHSALLDAEHRIKRKMAYVHLVSLPAKVKLIEYILAKGGLLIGNSVATTQTMTRLHFPRFVETSAGWYPARAHLYSPISLGDHLTVKTFEALVDDIRAKLMWGSLYYYYSTPKQPYPTITQHMFPFTPVELHRGWLLGRERLITAVPGTFTLGDSSPVKVYCYDAAGKLTDKHGQERIEQGRRLVALPLADKEMAVIEKRDPALAPVEYRVQLDELQSGFDKKTCWVHARAGAIPGSPPSVVLTMQKLLLTGSDVFYPLADMRTDDLGRTWSPPREHATTLGRRDEPGGVIVAACDFWPKWHAKTGKLLGVGHTVRYRDNRVIPDRQRETCYSVYDPLARSWAPWTTLAMPNAEKFFNAGAGCVQRVDLANGEILLPIYFKGQADKFTKVTVLRCAFDGRRMTVRQQGNDLSVDTDRGLGEPSLARFGGRYYLTLRHDKAGYVSTGDDGLRFGPPQKWLWDDGTDLGNYNTQQHWVTHDDALLLVYTRRGADNDHVFRHRAPLFIAQVDPHRLCVIRSTERILVPQRGARLGNFGVTDVCPGETWVTVTEWMQTNRPNPYDYTVPMRYGSNNAVFAARILWQKPNRGWSDH